MRQLISSIYDKPINNIYYGALALGQLVNTILTSWRAAH